MQFFYCIWYQLQCAPTMVIRQLINPSDSKGNYSATPNNTKLVHWPLMGGLLHLVQRGGAWVCCGPPRSLLAVPNVTPTHQRPVYQSLYCYMMIRRSAILMWCQPVRQEFMENECEALPGVAYPGVRDNRSTINTKTGYDDDDDDDLKG